MPRSTANRDRLPDGSFGGETFAAVRLFQGQQGLVQDGIVGRETLGELDALFSEDDPLYGMLKGIVRRGFELMKSKESNSDANAQPLDRACAGLARIIQNASGAQNRLAQAASRLQSSYGGKFNQT